MTSIRLDTVGVNRRGWTDKNELDKVERAATQALQPVDFIGGVDGARTRDPRRDRPVLQVSIHAAWRPIRIPKTSQYGCSLARDRNDLFQQLLSSRRQLRGSALRLRGLKAHSSRIGKSAPPLAARRQSLMPRLSLPALGHDRRTRQAGVDLDAAFAARHRRRGARRRHRP